MSRQAISYTTYKCDRCGAEASGEHQPQPNDTWLVVSANRPDGMCVETGKDLCKHCAVAFLTWLRGAAWAHRPDYVYIARSQLAHEVPVLVPTAICRDNVRGG